MEGDNRFVCAMSDVVDIDEQEFLSDVIPWKQIDIRLFSQVSATYIFFLTGFTLSLYMAFRSSALDDGAHREICSIICHWEVPFYPGLKRGHCIITRTFGKISRFAQRNVPIGKRKCLLEGEDSKLCGYFKCPIIDCIFF